MSPQVSKAIFGIGIVLSIAAIASIYVTMLANQNQSQNTQGTSSQQPASSGSAPATTGAASGASTTVSIPNGAAAQAPSLNKEYYKPISANISSGTKVTWTNQDIAAHTSTSGQSNSSPDSGKLFNTGTIAPGASGSAVITGSGKIVYHCIFHPWMIANVEIGSSGGEASNSTAQPT